MSEPIIFISRQRIKEGKLDAFKKLTRSSVAFMEANKPGTAGFLVYFNEDSTEVSIVHVFPDPAAMAAHLQGSGERAEVAYELMDPLGLEIFGHPGDEILAAMRQAAGEGVSLRVNPQRVGGYIHLQSP